MPPKKNFEDTHWGRMARQREANKKKKEEKERLKKERAELFSKGLCRGPDGDIYPIAEVGRKLGHLGAVDGHKGAQAGADS